MTEASGLVAIDPPAGPGGAGSVGFPLPYTQVVVRRSAGRRLAGRALRAGARWAALTVRGPTVSPGYRNPEHDRGVFLDGTLNTGDLAYVDATGRIHIAAAPRT